MLDWEKAIKDYIEEREKAWIKTYTGLHFHGFNPQPDQICLLDIAIPLSRKGRFADHLQETVNDEIINVGQHSINCYKMGKSFGFPNNILKALLLHDGAEAYVQDIPSPFKRYLPDYNELEHIIQTAIFTKYMEYPLDDDMYLNTVKYIDSVMLCHEILQLKADDKDFILPNVNYDLFPFDVLSTIKDWKSTKEEFLEIAKEIGIYE